MTLGSSIRHVRNIRRLRQIVGAFARRGFGRLILRLQLRPHLPFATRLEVLRERELARQAIPERLRLAFEDLGPSFIKLGQLLSARPDLIPADFVAELKRLQDRVPAVPFPLVRRIVEEAVGRPLGEAFRSFQETPIGSASIAQAHRAVLPTGEEVIVKVQRPGIGPLIERDISVLRTLAGLLERYVPELSQYNPGGVVDEFARAIRRELNFTREASAGERLRRSFRDSPAVYIPRVFWEYTTPRVLTLERVEGTPIDEGARLEAAGFDRTRLATAVAEAFMHMVFVEGFFHGDPHPGNLLVLKDGVLALVDFGIVGRIDDEVREAAANVFIALINRDFEDLVAQLLRLGVVGEGADLRAFQADLTDFVEPYYGRELGRIAVGRVVSEAIELAHRHGVRFPADLVLLGKTLLTVEGVARELDPGFNLLPLARPYATRLLRDRARPERLAAAVARAARDYGELARALPGQARQILTKIAQDRLKVEFVHVGLDNLIREMDRSSNRIAFGTVVASLIVGSSLIMVAGKGPLLFGFPVLGIAGFLFAGLLGLGLAIAILRSGRL
jgi:ubiquinone biosynthesis protein